MPKHYNVAMPSLTLRLLGTFEVTHAGQVIADFPTDKIRALLAYLAVEADRPHRRTSLAGLLWPDFSEQTALQNLRKSIYRLRKTLDQYQPGLSAKLLQVTTQEVRLSGQAIELDLFRFETLINRTAAHLHPERSTCQDCVDQLVEAMALYRDEFLAGMSLPDSYAFEEWQIVRRERYHQLAVSVLSDLASAFEKMGDFPTARTYAARQLALEPWREESHRRLMRLLARSGQFSGALAQYRRCYEALMGELDVEPMADTTALYERILAAHQQPWRHNLPSQPTALIGRQEELSQLGRRILDPSQRLITITGPGGIGKTRLVIEAAAAHVDTFLNGVCFTALAGLDRESSLVFAIADALGYTFPGMNPPLEELIAYLQNREVLLVLDNFEHLIDQVGILQKILEAAPDLKVLVTSRERLQLRWESIVSLDGLAYPPETVPEKITTYPAVQLFFYFARRLVPAFNLDGENDDCVGQLCRRVAGLPLAIELAATQVADQSCRDLLRGIDHHLDALASALHDLPSRHRSLRATFDHTWSRLDGDQRQAFMGLSIFRGGFTLEAALQIVGVSPQTLIALAAKSLLRLAEGGRYEVHEVLRQYAAERLEADGETYEAARDRHCAYYAGMLEGVDRYSAAASSHLRPGISGAAKFQNARAELDNFRAGWQWAVNRELLDEIRRACGGLGRLFEMAGLYHEAETNFGLAITHLKGKSGLQPQKLNQTLGRLLVEQARFRSALGDQARAMEAAQRAIQLAQETGNYELESLGFLGLGHALWQQGDFSEARVHLVRAQSLAEATGLPGVEAGALNRLGIIASDQGDYKRAIKDLERALELYEASDDLAGTAVVLDGLGRVVGDRGDIKGARGYFEKALDLARELGDRRQESRFLKNLGIAEFHLGNYEESRICLEHVLPIFRTMGDRAGEMATLLMLGNLDQQQDQFAAAGFHYHRTLKILEETGRWQHESVCLRSLGRCALFQGEYERARHWLQKSWEVSRERGHQLGEIDDLGLLGLLALLTGDPAAAERSFSAAELLIEAVDDDQGQVQLLVYRALLSLHLGSDGAAQEASSRAASIAEESGLRSFHAEALTCLGHALSGLDDLDQAVGAYEGAIALYRQMKAHKRLLESRAGLVRVAQRRRQMAAAVDMAKEILFALEEDPLEGMLQPFRVFLTCFRALRESKDPQAAQVLHRAYTLLQERAALFSEKGQRTAYLEGIPAHRELLDEYAQLMPLQND